MGNTLFFVTKVFCDFIFFQLKPKRLKVFHEKKHPILVKKESSLSNEKAKPKLTHKKILKKTKTFKLHKNIHVSQSDPKIWCSNTNNSHIKNDYSIESRVQKCRTDTLSSYTSNSISLLSTGEIISSSLEAKKYTIKFWNIVNGALKCVKVSFFL